MGKNAFCKDLEKMWTLFSRIAEGILEPKPFHLYNWDISFHISSMVVDLSGNEFSEQF